MRSAVRYVREIILANHLMENIASVKSDADVEMMQSIVYHINGDSYSSYLPSLLKRNDDLLCFYIKIKVNPSINIRNKYLNENKLGVDLEDILVATVCSSNRVKGK